MASLVKRKWRSPGGAEKEAWTVRWLDPSTGRRPAKTFALKKDADLYRRQVEREIEDGQFLAQTSSITVEEAHRRYFESLDRRKREGTYREASYRKEDSHFRLHVLPRFGGRLLVDLTLDDADRFLASLRDKKLASKSIAAIFAGMGRMIDFSMRRGWVKRNVVREVRTWAENRLPPTEKIRTFSIDEARRLYEFFLDPRAHDATWRPRTAAQGRAVVFLAMFCGLRSGEIRGLAWANLDFDSGMIRVVQQVNERRKVAPPKTPSAVRVVPVPDVVLRVLDEWRAFALPNPNDLLFSTGRGTPLTPTDLHNIYWRRALKHLGYSHRDKGGLPHFHALRHFAAAMMARVLPIGDVGPVLGHKHFDTTLRVYTGATLESTAQRSAIQSMADTFIPPVTSALPAPANA